MGWFLGPHVEVKGFLVPKDQEVIVLLKKGVGQSWQEKGALPMSG